METDLEKARREFREHWGRIEKAPRLEALIAAEREDSSKTCRARLEDARKEIDSLSKTMDALHAENLSLIKAQDKLIRSGGVLKDAAAKAVEGLDDLIHWSEAYMNYHGEKFYGGSKPAGLSGLWPAIDRAKAARAKASSPQTPGAAKG